MYKIRFSCLSVYTFKFSLSVFFTMSYPSLWKVLTWISVFTSFSILSFISLLEALVNDNIKISLASTLFFVIKYLTFPIIVVVFPLPAPAIIKLLCFSLTIDSIWLLSKVLPSIVGINFLNSIILLWMSNISLKVKFESNSVM